MYIMCIHNDSKELKLKHQHNNQSFKGSQTKVIEIKMYIFCYLINYRHIHVTADLESKLLSTVINKTFHTIIQS